jgi:hypothetical protein
MPWPEKDRGVSGISCRVRKLHVLMLLASAGPDSTKKFTEWGITIDTISMFQHIRKI